MGRRGKRLEEVAWCLHFTEVGHYQRESAPQRPPLQRKMERYESWLRDPSTPLWLRTEGRYLLRDSNLDILLDFVRLEPEVQTKAITRGYPGLIEALEWMTQMVDWVYQEREERERKVRRRRQRGNTDLEWEEPDRPAPEWEEPERPAPKREEPERPTPKREEPERPQPKKGESVRPAPKRGESVRPQPKRGKAEHPQPRYLPAEGEFLLVTPPPPWEDCESLPPPPAEGQYLLVPPPPPWEDDMSLPPPPAEGKYLLVPPPAPWEDDVSLPPPPAEGKYLLVPPPAPWEDDVSLPPPPAEGKYLLVPPPPPWEDEVSLPPPPAEGEYLLVPPPSPWEDWVSLPPPPGEGEYLLVPPPPPWEDCESLPPPPAEGKYLLVPPPAPWEDDVSLPPPPAEGKYLLVPPPPPWEDEVSLPPPPAEGEYLLTLQRITLHLPDQLSTKESVCLSACISQTISAPRSLSVCLLVTLLDHLLAGMEKSLVVILLLAGLCDDASCHSRTYIPVGEIKTWTDARSYCREKHTDLVTVRSLEEQQQILNVAKDYQFWIGLYRDSDNWQWSNGDAVSYTNWTAGTGGLFCATADAGGSWGQSVCHDQKPFMCYNDPSAHHSASPRPAQHQGVCLSVCLHLPDHLSTKESVCLSVCISQTSSAPRSLSVCLLVTLFDHSLAGMEKSLVVILLLAGLCDDASCHSRTYIPVGDIKTWTDARSYCREKHTDLVTVRSLEEQQQILNVAKDYQFWIGLYRDSENWQWSNGDAVSYTKWTAGTGGVFCATADAGGSWGQSVCHDQKPFMCYNGKM
ncbi:UNVERIFIED_CONTAM: hypothetical protein FKN15_027983 [Acipenser sinensis]